MKKEITENFEKCKVDEIKVWNFWILEEIEKNFEIVSVLILFKSNKLSEMSTTFIIVLHNLLHILEDYQKKI